MPKHMVECFGSLGTRQFAIDGPHTRRQRRGDQHLPVRRGASPATTPRASLPVLPKAAYAQACDLFDEIAAAAGLTAVKESQDRPGRSDATCVSSSTPTPRSRRSDYGAMTVAELERLMRARGAHANAPATLRCSGSFHDPTRVRTDTHLINWGRYGLGIYDTMTETTWHRRERAPSARFEFLGQLQQGTHSDERARTTTFDGDAISRADREFLASLSDHPLARHPLYSVPPPPRPNYDGCTTVDDRTEAQKACFPAALDWMLVNYAYYAGAFMGKGGIISLVDGKMATIASMRGFMQPYTIVEEGPRGGLKKTSVVDVWMTHPLRAQIDAIQSRSDKPRPTFEEDGLIVYNRYWPPAHPTRGRRDRDLREPSSRGCFRTTAEREWFWHWLAHKARRPWVPMVAVIMVAEEFGTGRGTLFDILDLLFGEDYVVPCTFGELTGTSASARFNARLANALFAVVNEAVAEDGHQQTQRRLHYDALKNVIDPSPTARRRFEAKGQHAYAQRSAMSHDHRDPASRRREAAARRPALRGPDLRPQDDAGGADRNPGLDGDPEEHRRAASGAAGDACGAARSVRPVWRAAALRRAARDDRDGRDAAGGSLRGGDRGAGRVSAVHDDASAAADRLLRRLHERRLVEHGPPHRRQERLPAARAKRTEQPHQVPQAE